MITIKVQTKRDGILCGYNTHQSITQNLLSAVPIFFWRGRGEGIIVWSDSKFLSPLWEGPILGVAVGREGYSVVQNRRYCWVFGNIYPTRLSSSSQIVFHTLHVRSLIIRIWLQNIRLQNSTKTKAKHRNEKKQRSTKGEMYWRKL